MVTVLFTCRRPLSELDVLTLKCVKLCKSIIGCLNVQYRVCPPPQLHTDDAWRQPDLNGALGDVLPFIL